MGLLGGILGGIIGSAFAGPWGAAMGAGIGYMLGGKKNDAAQAGTPPETLVFLFRALAKIAKVDGVVSAEEAAFVTEMLQSFGKENPALRKQLKKEFDNAKSDGTSFEEEVRNLNARLTPQARHSAMEMFCTLARVDNYLDDAERSLLLQAEAIFGLDGFVDRFFNGSRQRRPAATGSNGSLADAYRTLGITASASDSEVKAAWHQKTKEFHPDRLAGKGLSEAFIEFAEGEMKKVNLAYETIMNARKK